MLSRAGWHPLRVVAAAGVLVILLAGYAIQAAELTGSLPCVHHECGDQTGNTDQPADTLPSGGCADCFCHIATPYAAPDTATTMPLRTHPEAGQRLVGSLPLPDAPVFGVERPPQEAR